MLRLTVWCRSLTPIRRSDSFHRPAVWVVVLVRSHRPGEASGSLLEPDRRGPGRVVQIVTLAVCRGSVRVVIELVITLPDRIVLTALLRDAQVDIFPVNDEEPR